jgi:hypothetical protein
MLRDTHGEQGRFLAVGHLLHPEDLASKETLFRDAATGASSAPAGSRVLDRLVTTAAAYFSAQWGTATQFLLQTNVDTGYGPGQALTPSTARPIPARAHGLDAFKNVHHVAALCVTNPKPQHLTWLAQRTGLPKATITRAFRIHSVYQGLGRCSIRNRAMVSSPKTLLTAGKDDAAFILDLFPGSLWLGQVGNMPSVSQGQKKPKAPTKVDTEAARIRDYLDSLSTEVTKISSQSLRAELRGDLSVSSWGRAVRQAAPAGTGWRMEGKSVIRETWEYLTAET